MNVRVSDKDGWEATLALRFVIREHVTDNPAVWKQYRVLQQKWIHGAQCRWQDVPAVADFCGENAA